MKFSEVVTQAIAWLQREGRVSYRALKREFDLEDDFLEDLKEELITVKEVAADKDGKMLVWAGQNSLESSVQGLESGFQKNQKSKGKGQKAKVKKKNQSLIPNPQPPVSYTPSHLAERIRAEQAGLEARGATGGERKTITALFADLKGSTALIEDLDPEEAQRVIDPALQLMMDAVHQYEGYVAKTLGDGILALFGAPIAHEDHSHRALYAALRMQEEMRRYSDTLRGKGYPPLLMRVGLNTGEVVVRSIRKDDLHTDYDPIGHSTHVASRMEQLATPGAIVVSAHTQKLTDGYFAFKDLGPTQIKGIAELLNIYELQGVGPLRTRLHVSARRGLTRFVGRQSEMQQLQQALEQAKAGHGQIVGTMGEPGLGKSRLFYEFKLLSLNGCLVLEAYSVSHGKATAYLPVIELLKSYFDIQTTDDERKRREKVGGKVLMLDRSLEDTLPYLFALLGIEEQPSPLAHMDPQIRRRRTFDALKKLFLRESLNQPLVLIFEDLHWIDSETQGFLDVLSESVASAKLLLLTNYRPEYRHEWGQKTYYTQLRLAPLGRAEAEEFLDVLLGAPSSPQPSLLRGEGDSPRPIGERDRVRGMDNNLQALKQLILDKTQGTPFFMEEIVQELFEQGVLRREASVGWDVTQPTTDLHIPPTVQAVLAARIGRLAPDEKALLQQLSVIGRQFSMSLIRQVIAQSEAELYRLLTLLQHKEFLYEQPAFPESEYIFKHALTQDVAYGTVLQEQRKVLHERTGQAIEQIHKDQLDEHYSELAHHYQRSGNAEKAIEYLQKAGQQAVQRSAHEEAIASLTTAIALLKDLPGLSSRHAQVELTLQLSLAPPFVATHGYSAPEVEKIYARAYELSQQQGSTPELFRALYGLWFASSLRGELQTAKELAEQFFNRVQPARDSGLLMLAHRAMGNTLFWRGEFSFAQSHSAQGVELYNPLDHHVLAFLYGSHPVISCLFYEAAALWHLGYPDQALSRVERMLTLAYELDHPFSLAIALNFAAWIYGFRRDWSLIQQRAEAAISLCSEQGFTFWLMTAWNLHDAALRAQDQPEESLTRAEKDAITHQRYGGVGMQTWAPGCLAERYGRTEQVDKGVAVLEEAISLARHNDEVWNEAELYRLKGELLLMQAEKLREHEFATN